MNKGLKIVLAVYGAGLTVVGISYLLFGQEDVRRVLGASLLAVGPFLILAARDVFGQIQWARFGIVFALLFLGVSVYLGLFVRNEFGSVMPGILIHGTFAVLLLLFYPWRAARGEERMTRDDTNSGTVVVEARK